MPASQTIRWCLLILAGMAGGIGGMTPSAMAQLSPGAAAPAAGGVVSTDHIVTITSRRSSVEIVERLSKVIELDQKISRVDGFDPEIIEVKALAPNRVRVQAITQGVTAIVLTDADGGSWSIEVFVLGDSRHLQAVINNRFPDSAVEAYKVQDAVALTGWVSQPEHITQIVEIAEQFYPRVLNQMRVGGVQQVKLKVKIMEVQRSRLRTLGINFLVVGQDGFLSSNPGQIYSLNTFNLSPGATTVSVADASLNVANAVFGLVTSQFAVEAFIEALRQEELLKILAEPILVTTNGRPATMLSGGEFPIAVPQSLGTLSIEWRDFGVRLEAVPIILGDGRVRLDVMPEVSERDFANALTFGGTTVPALTLRRVNTQVEMRFGQTLMLAGLLSSRQTARTVKVPFFGELPWAGALFRKTRYEDVETELVILLTPELVAPLDPGQVPPGGPGTSTTIPTDRELMFDGYLEVPNYGDQCAFCNGQGSCPSGCQTYGGVTQRLTLPIQEERIPLTDAAGIRSGVGVLPISGSGVKQSSQASGAVPGSRGAEENGATRQVGYTQPARSANLTTPPNGSTTPGTQGVTGTSGRPVTGTGSAAGESKTSKKSSLPGLIEP